MKRTLLAGLAATTLLANYAYAADMRVKAAPPPPAPVPVATWTGCYIGANAGWASAETSVSFGGTGDFSRSKDGGSFGGQIGCDYQFASNWVIGIQGMLDGTNLEADRLSGRFPNTNFHAELERFATITARLGFTVTPAFLIYGKVGWGSYRTSLEAINTLTGVSLGSVSTTHSGLDLGFGGEWMFAPSWSVWFEWDRIFPQDKTAFLPNLAGGTTATVRRDLDKFLVGVNWRFMGGRAY